MRPILNDIALFIEVVKAGNFSNAAERLEMPPSTLSRRISGLERQIGFKLLNRTTRRVEVTAEGQAYFHRCQALIEEVSLAHELVTANRNTVTGTLRLACTTDFANLYLSSCVRRYLDANPLVSVELTMSSRVESLLADQLDLAIRLGPLRDLSLISFPLGWLHTGVYASPDLMGQLPEIKHPNDLANVPCVRIGSLDTASRWGFKNDHTDQSEIIKVAVTGRVIAGGPQMASQLVVSGLGVGILDQRLAAPLVKQGKLLSVLTGWQPLPVPVHAVTLSRLMPARVRAFIDLLRKEIAFDKQHSD